MGKLFSYILVILALVLGLAFAVLNAQPVAFNFYIGSVELPLSLMLTAAMVIGTLLTLSVILINKISSS